MLEYCATEVRIPAGGAQKLILIVQRGGRGEFVLEEFFNSAELWKRKLAVSVGRRGDLFA